MDQRLCLIPDEIYDVLCDGDASVVTDTIDHFDEAGVVLASGARIDADVVVPATGLKLQFLGGIAMEVDGAPIDPTKLVTYRGMMFADVPNWIAVIGYTNASWTLKADLTSEYLCRLLRRMDEKGYDSVVPRRRADGEATRPIMAGLTSGYVKRGAEAMPKQGTRHPWTNSDDYLRDLLRSKLGRIDDGSLEYTTKPAAARPKRLDVRGKTAVVTGAASGIGAALAGELARRGCHLVLVDLRETLAEVADAARPRACASRHTCSTWATRTRWSASARRSPRPAPRSISFFNNAGVALGGRVDEVSREDLEWLMNINFYGVANLTRALLPTLLRRPDAHVANVSSVFGLVAPPGQAAYCASVRGPRLVRGAPARAARHHRRRLGDPPGRHQDVDRAARAGRRGGGPRGRGARHRPGREELHHHPRGSRATDPRGRRAAARAHPRRPGRAPHRGLGAALPGPEHGGHRSARRLEGATSVAAYDERGGGRGGARRAARRRAHGARLMPSPIASAPPSVGGLALGALRGVQRLALRVRVHRHVDRRGRVTPWLEVGRAARGTLVWLHGFSDRFDTILQVAPHLAREWRILSPSMPAFGEGWVDPSETHTFDAYADWMAEVVGAIAPERFHLMGNSLGGATALGVAVRLPDRVETVIALNAAGVRVDGLHCAHAEIAGGDNLFEIRSRADYERLNGRVFATPIAIPRWIEAQLFEDAKRRADWHIRIGNDLAASPIRHQADGWFSYVPLPDVSPPALVLWGDRDSLFPVEHGERMAATVANGTFERLEGVGHVAHLERPKRLAAAFTRWTRRMS
ncbi:MAG: SDR family NAD(P)-dependent oxidoreductase [Sandaracinaceae bacterium]